jgi:putative membrane protein
MGLMDRTLILCIDGDDDIGLKTEVNTPIIGRSRNLQHASALALSDPEEADANAMFGAVKLLDNLSKEHPDESFQVATIAGLQKGGVESDRKITNELNTVLKDYPATGVILVTDGYSDEFLIPIIQSYLPIVSIHHVVVKHSERIEETWALIFRYLRMLYEDTYYSRIVLGVPGIIFVLLGFLVASNQLENAGMVVSVVIGIALFLKGFGLDERISEIVSARELPPIERQMIIASGAVGLILSIIGSYLGITNASNYLPSESMPFWEFSFWAPYMPTLVGAFLLKGIDLIVLGVMVALFGGMAANYMIRDRKIWRNIVGVIVIFWIRFITIESGKVLLEPEKSLTLFSPLVFFTIAGVATTIFSVVYIYKGYRNFSFT